MDIQLVTSPNGTITGAIYYNYHPSAGAAWLFLSLFAVATIGQFVLMFPYRSAFFIPMIIGGIMETFGYYGRAWSSRDRDNFGPWIMQTLLIMAAAPMLSATVYMALDRMVRALDARENALMSPKAATPLFVCADIIAFISQLAGIALQAARSASAHRIGRIVVLAGLIFQVVLFCLFIANIIVFHKRNDRNPRSLSMNPHVPDSRRRIYALYVASGCILLRNIVRIAEYVQGGQGEVSEHEAFLYIFDATLMWLAMAAVLIFHPGKLVKRARQVAAGTGKDEEESNPMTEQVRA